MVLLHWDRILQCYQAVRLMSKTVAAPTVSQIVKFHFQKYFYKHKREIVAPDFLFRQQSSGGDWRIRCSPKNPINIIYRVVPSKGSLFQVLGPNWNYRSLFVLCML